MADTILTQEEMVIAAYPSGPPISPELLQAYWRVAEAQAKKLIAWGLSACTEHRARGARYIIRRFDCAQCMSKLKQEVGE